MYNKNNKKKKVVLALWADPSYYLATIFTSQFLSKNDFEVDLVYRKSSPLNNLLDHIEFGKNTQLHPVGNFQNGWRDKIDYVKFLIKLIFLVRKKKPGVVIGYNRLGLLASFVATKIFSKTRLIYHNYDFDSSQLTDFKGQCELFAARNANLTIFPAFGRSEEYKSIANLTRKPLNVLKCYSRTYSIKKTGELNEIIKKRGLSFDRLVIRLGMIGPFHAIKATIRSMREWKGNWGFILGGIVSEAYLAELYQLVEELGLENKIIILPSISQSLWYDILSVGDLGISLYNFDPQNIGHSYMAGTSQKLNGYFVAGIPSIVPNTLDFKLFIDKYGTCKSANVLDPKSIAKAINSLLLDTEEYNRYCKNVRKAFRSDLNFEKQFESVFSWINDPHV